MPGRSRMDSLNPRLEPAVSTCSSLANPGRNGYKAILCSLDRLCNCSATMLRVKPRQPWTRGLAARGPGPGSPQDEEQLVHGCDARHLLGFAPPTQSSMESTDGGVVTSGGQRWPCRAWCTRRRDRPRRDATRGTGRSRGSGGPRRPTRPVRVR